MLGEDLGHGGGVSDVGLDEAVAGIGLNLSQRGKVRGVGQLVDIDDAFGAVGDQVAADGQPDEAGAAGENFQAASPGQGSVEQGLERALQLGEGGPGGVAGVDASPTAIGPSIFSAGLFHRGRPRPGARRRR